MIRVSLVLIFLASQALASELTVRVKGAMPNQGQMLISLFASEKDWMKAPVAEATVSVDSSGQATTRFEGLEQGLYGVSIVYDEDRDGELDLNFLGIPTEKFGFSNDASALFGPPNWDASKFTLTGESHQIMIGLDQAN